MVKTGASDLFHFFLINHITLKAVDSETLRSTSEWNKNEAFGEKMKRVLHGKGIVQNYHFASHADFEWSHD